MMPLIQDLPTEQEALIAVRTLLRFIGEDPEREGLKDTPRRVLKAWKNDWGLGYSQAYQAIQLASIKGGQFGDGAENVSEMIAVQEISFDSHCEHHMAIFTGSAHIAYIPAPGGKILGLSKLVRIVDMFSKRLQVQERLTSNIADFLNDQCKPIGVGVLVRAAHSCMTSRGVKQPATLATTSALRGEMLTKPEVRDEFYRLVGR